MCVCVCVCVCMCVCVCVCVRLCVCVCKLKKLNHCRNVVIFELQKASLIFAKMPENTFEKINWFFSYNQDCYFE